MEYVDYIFPNNFIWDETISKFVVTFSRETLSEYFTSDYDTYVVKCLRMDGERYRQIILYYEVTEYGDLTLYFDDTFYARISIASSMT